jgi:hypothetical protein
MLTGLEGAVGDEVCPEGVALEMGEDVFVAREESVRGSRAGRSSKVSSISLSQNRPC